MFLLVSPENGAGTRGLQASNSSDDSTTIRGCQSSKSLHESDRKALRSGRRPHAGSSRRRYAPIERFDGGLRTSRYRLYRPRRRREHAEPIDRSCLTCPHARRPVTRSGRLDHRKCTMSRGGLPRHNGRRRSPNSMCCCEEMTVLEARQPLRSQANPACSNPLGTPRILLPTLDS